MLCVALESVYIKILHTIVQKQAAAAAGPTIQQNFQNFLTSGAVKPGEEEGDLLKSLSKSSPWFGG